MARQAQKRRPIYTPKFKQELGLYTEGKEWMFADTLEEYIGLYHKYPNTSVYSGAEWNSRSKLLIPYATQTMPTDLKSEDGETISDSESNNNSIYFRLTGTRFDEYYTPPFHYPQPTNEMYDVGFMNRYFVQKINEPSVIIEVNPEEFDRSNAKNQPGIDAKLYKKLRIKWTIDGPLKDARNANLRILQFNENKFPGITSYLSDLDEFHKNRHKIKPE